MVFDEKPLLSIKTIWWLVKSSGFLNKIFLDYQQKTIKNHHLVLIFLGITFDSIMTFVKHFEDILDQCIQKFYCLRILVNKKWVPSPTTISQIYKQCVRPVFKLEIVSTMTVSDTVINKLQRVQNSFIRLALRLPKYVSVHLHL